MKFIFYIILTYLSITTQRLYAAEEWEFVFAADDPGAERIVETASNSTGVYMLLHARMNTPQGPSWQYYLLALDLQGNKKYLTLLEGIDPATQIVSSEGNTLYISGQSGQSATVSSINSTTGQFNWTWQSMPNLATTGQISTHTKNSHISLLSKINGHPGFISINKSDGSTTFISQTVSTSLSRLGDIFLSDDESTYITYSDENTTQPSSAFLAHFSSTGQILWEHNISLEPTSIAPTDFKLNQGPFNTIWLSLVFENVLGSFGSHTYLFSPSGTLIKQNDWCLEECSTDSQLFSRSVEQFLANSGTYNDSTAGLQNSWELRLFDSDGQQIKLSSWVPSNGSLPSMSDFAFGNNGGISIGFQSQTFPQPTQAYLLEWNSEGLPCTEQFDPSLLRHDKVIQLTNGNWLISSKASDSIHIHSRPASSLCLVSDSIFNDDFE